jgi:hypothetical protein
MIDSMLVGSCLLLGKHLNRCFKHVFLLIGSMKDAPRTVAPQRHLLSRPIPSRNQNQISISVSFSPTPTSTSSSTPSPSLELAPTPSTIWGASVRGASFVLPSQFYTKFAQSHSQWIETNGFS